jgi:predicted DNA-binding ribbon-helix-helix protein
MRSSIIKRSVAIAGHKTSVSLENAFWESLKDVARQRKMTLGDLVGQIDSERHAGNLSSAIRLFVLGRFRDPLTAQEKRHRTREVLGKCFSNVGEHDLESVVSGGPGGI